MMVLESLLELHTLDGLEPTEALDAIAVLVDHAMDTRDLKLNAQALTWAGQLEPRLTTDTDLAMLDYYRANAWAHQQSESCQDRNLAWAWDLEPLRQQILLLRSALNRACFKDLPTHAQCQILTNLGNQLSFAGRFVEAREFWSRAVVTLPDFWMARFNRGYGMLTYARCLYDDGHRCAIAMSAHSDMTDAIVSLDAHPEYGDSRLRESFLAKAEEIASHVDLAAFAADYDADGFSLGDDADEQDYRNWCLQQCLFLNPLNDTGPHSIAARDVMQLPTFTTEMDERPVVLGLFNQLKQEFVSARWLYFDGITMQGMHFSDRDVGLYNTLDYPVLGLAAEKVKLAFRMSYSLFDKIAFFLNHYLKLGIPEKEVYFRSIWRDKKTGAFRPAFNNVENLAFRGLYWLSKDFFDPDFKDTTEPEARACHEMRNHLEHKYVKLHSLMMPRPSSTPGAFDLFEDDLAYSLSVADLDRRTLRILKLARSALIYLLLGMNQEERRRRSAFPSDRRAAEMSLHMVDDANKQRLW
jgi:hypothetical protein